MLRGLPRSKELGWLHSDRSSSCSSTSGTSCAWVSCGSGTVYSSCTATSASSCDPVWCKCISKYANGASDAMIMMTWYAYEHIATLLDSIKVKYFYKVVNIIHDQSLRTWAEPREVHRRLRPPLLKGVSWRTKREQLQRTLLKCNSLEWILRLVLSLLLLLNSAQGRRVLRLKNWLALLYMRLKSLNCSLSYTHSLWLIHLGLRVGRTKVTFLFITNAWYLIDFMLGVIR
jgi:hypothetical protein